MQLAFAAQRPEHVLERFRHIIAVERIAKTFGGERDKALLRARIAACGRLLQRNRAAQAQSELQQAAVFGVQPCRHLRRRRERIGHRSGQMRRMDDDLPRTQPARIVIEDGHVEVGDVIAACAAKRDIACHRRLRRRRGQHQHGWCGGALGCGARSGCLDWRGAADDNRPRCRSQEPPGAVDAGDELGRLAVLGDRPRLDVEADEVAVALAVERRLPAPFAAIGEIEAGGEQIDIDRPLLGSCRHRHGQGAIFCH